MDPDKENLQDRTAEQLRKQAREEGITGTSGMRKDELVTALADRSKPPTSAGEWVRARSLGLFFIALFLVSWIGQLVVQWYEFVSEQQQHGELARFWSGDFWSQFGQATLENWQSEFLQLATFTIAAAYLVFKGSSESPDGSERMEQKLDALLEERGIDPAEVEATLPAKYRKR